MYKVILMTTIITTIGIDLDGTLVAGMALFSLAD